MCIDVNFILAYVIIGSYVSCVSTHFTLATVYREMLVIDEPVHVSVGLRLLEMSSITTPNQIISNVCTRYIFKKNIGNFSDLL